MQERRRDPRIPIHLQLKISNMFKQDHFQIDNLNAHIEVTDISKSGIGFLSAAIIPINFYFDAVIAFSENDNKICTVIKVIRSVTQENNMIEYGCEFIGLSVVFVDIIEEYEKNLLNQK